MENSNIFKDARIGDYQNENFKKFLKNIKFNIVDQKRAILTFC